MSFFWADILPIKQTNSPLPLPEERTQNNQGGNNKCPIYWLLDEKQPLAQIQLFSTEAAKYVPNKSVTALLADCWYQGGGSYSADHIRQALAFEGAHYSSSYSPDHIGMTLSVPKAGLSKLLPLLQACWYAPQFEEQPVQTSKEQFKQQIAINQKKPLKGAFKELLRLVFGPTHPYGYALDSADLDQCTMANLKQRYAAWLPKGVACVASGGWSDKNKAQLVQLMADWPTSRYAHEAGSLPAIPAYRPQKKHMRWEKNKQDALVLAMPTIMPNHPDYRGVYLVTKLFGGYFIGSRLMQSIREKRGYTYGIGAQIKTWKRASLLLIRSSVKKGKGKETADLVRAEMEKLSQTEVPTNELNQFKAYMAAVCLKQVEHIFLCAHARERLSWFGLDLGHFRALKKQLDALTPERIKDLARRYLTPERLTEVLIS